MTRVVAGRRVEAAIAAGLALALSACVGGVKPPSEAPPLRLESNVPSAKPIVPRINQARIIPSVPIRAVPIVTRAGATTARGAGVIAGPSIAALPISEDQAADALTAYASSCAGLVRRTDTSGLTRGDDWRAACDAAKGGGVKEARRFLSTWFETAQIGDGSAFATGYYEPEIAGAREARNGYVPIYGRPQTLIDVDLGQFSDDLKGKKIRGRVDGTKFVPFFERSQIEDGALVDHAPILAWAADPVALFFLQIQGSGRVRMDDGSVLRIGYDTQNGRAYTGIGALMRKRGLLSAGQTSMQGIVAWLHDHPADGRKIMDENKSYVFFRVLSGSPVGALGYPVTGQVSAAVDTRFVPLGAPVFLSMDRLDATGLWVAQDTGGAIKGANRFDTYWGAGQVAETIAGGMAAHGTAFVLLPVGTVARLNAASTRAPAQP